MKPASQLPSRPDIGQRRIQVHAELVVPLYQVGVADTIRREYLQLRILACRVLP